MQNYNNRSDLLLVYPMFINKRRVSQERCDWAEIAGMIQMGAIGVIVKHLFGVVISEKTNT